MSFKYAILTSAVMAAFSCECRQGGTKTDPAAVPRMRVHASAAAYSICQLRKYCDVVEAQITGWGPPEDWQLPSNAAAPSNATAAVMRFTPVTLQVSRVVAGSVGVGTVIAYVYSDVTLDGMSEVGSLNCGMNPCIVFLGRSAGGRLVIYPPGGLFWRRDNLVFNAGLYRQGLNTAEFYDVLAAPQPSACPEEM